MRGSILAVAVTALGVLTASPAAADTRDDRFIASLDSRGIAYTSRNAAILAGYRVCQQVQSLQITYPRATNEAVLLQIVDQVYRETTLSNYDAGYFVGASVVAYCPEDRSYPTTRREYGTY